MFPVPPVALPAPPHGFTMQTVVPVLSSRGISTSSLNRRSLWETLLQESVFFPFSQEEIQALPDLVRNALDDFSQGELYPTLVSSLSKMEKSRILARRVKREEIVQAATARQLNVTGLKYEVFSKVLLSLQGNPLLEDERAHLSRNFLRWNDVRLGKFSVNDYLTARTNQTILISREQHNQVQAFSSQAVLDAYSLEDEPIVFLQSPYAEGACFPNPEMALFLLHLFHPEHEFGDEGIKWIYDVLASSDYFNDLFQAAFWFLDQDYQTERFLLLFPC